MEHLHRLLLSSNSASTPTSVDHTMWQQCRHYYLYLHLRKPNSHRGRLKISFALFLDTPHASEHSLSRSRRDRLSCKERPMLGGPGRRELTNWPAAGFSL